MTNSIHNHSSTTNPVPIMKPDKTEPGQNEKISKKDETTTQQKIQTSSVLTDIVGACCKLIPSFEDIVNAFNAFQPLLSFFNSTGEKKVSDLTKILTSIKEDNMSCETKEAFDKFKETITTLSSDQEFANKDISDVIQKWRQSGKLEEIVSLIKLIQQDKVKALEKQPELKEKFIDALKTFSEAMQEARSNGGHKTEAELKKGLDKTVDTLDSLNNGKKNGLVGDDGCINEKGRKFVTEKMTEVAEQGKKVAEDPELSKYIPNSKEKLIRLYNSIIEFFREWEKEEEERREKEKKEKLCAERKEAIKKSNKLHILHKISKQKSNQLKLKEEKEKAELAKINYFKKALSIFREIGIEKELKAGLSFISGQKKKEISNEAYYKYKENNVLDSMPEDPHCEKHQEEFNVFG